MDVLFGSLSTLLGALGAYCIGRQVKKRGSKASLSKLLIPIPNFLANIIIVPWVLRLVYGDTGAIWFLTLTVGIGEAIAGIGLGLILLFSLEKHAKNIFK